MRHSAEYFSNTSTPIYKPPTAKDLSHLPEPQTSKPLPQFQHLPEPLDSPKHQIQNSKSKYRAIKIFFEVVLWILALAILFVAWPPKWGGLSSLAIVAGRSMEPTYHTLDLVLAVKQKQYQPGDIVLYVAHAEDGQTGRIIHRIKSVNKDGTFLLQGDNNPNIDPWSVPQDWIEGKAVGMLPQGGRWFAILRSPLVLAVLGGIFVAWQVSSIQRKQQRKKENGEDDDEDENNMLGKNNPPPVVSNQTLPPNSPFRQL